MKKIIINADDFGYSKVFNEKILELIEKDFVSATSVMVDWINDQQNEQVEKLIELSRTYNISVGLHIDFKNTNFKEEILRQYEKFKEIFDFEPLHIDLHKSIYLNDGYPFIIDFSEEKNIPCKNLGVEPFTGLMPKEEMFNGTNSSFEVIKDWLDNLKDDGFDTVIFHPGIYDVDCKSSLNKDREVDAEKIVQLNSVLKDYNAQLVSYTDFINNK